MHSDWGIDRLIEILVMSELTPFKVFTWQKDLDISMFISTVLQVFVPIGASASSQPGEQTLKWHYIRCILITPIMSRMYMYINMYKFNITNVWVIDKK
jgi:hypothetical protein